MTVRLGRYRIDSELGRGGMGIVYRAVDERLGKIVALKILKESAADSSASQAGRLRREARAAAILNHPSIVTVYDYDEADGRAFIVYEYVEGKTLDQLISQGPLPEPRLLEIAEQVAGGLAYAHARGILHRDIKPQNIIVAADGAAKILDYGMAKRGQPEIVPVFGGVPDESGFATEAGMIVGTTQYMSPEQIGGESLDARSDIFALGIVMYEMATGVNPFRGNNLASTIGKIVTAEPEHASGPPPGISRALWEIIGRCLRKRREERYPGAMMIVEDIRRLRSSTSRSGQTAPDAIPTGPLISPVAARAMLILLQFLFLAIYAVALIRYGDVYVVFARHAVAGFGGHIAADRLAMILTTILLTSGCCGIAVRLYLIASVGFDDPETGKQFRRLFPGLFVLDEMWALTPLLLIDKWPAGFALICVALLAYLPISHRNLIRFAYSRA